MPSKYVLAMLLSLILVSHVAPSNLSPLDTTDRMRFTIIDISILMSSVPSLLTTRGIESVVLATQVFLDIALNIPPTTVDDIKIAITSQSLNNGGIQPSRLDNSTSFVLSADLQVLVTYQLASEDPNLNDMGQRIRSLISEEWDELQALLKLLDPSFFGLLNAIHLKPNPHLPSLAGDVGKQREQSPSRKPAPRVIIILLAAGIGAGISLLTIIPLFHMKSTNRPQPRQNRTMSTSQTDLGLAPYSSKEVAISVSSTTISDLPYDNSEGYIQKIYSDDKVTNSLSGIRVQKRHAENMIAHTLNNLERSFDKSDRRKSGSQIIRQVSTTSTTDHASDLESQGSFPPRTQHVKRRAESTLFHSSGARRVNFAGAVESSDFHPFWIAPKILESDESSLSTMTGGVLSEDEDVELDVLSGVRLPSKYLRRSRTYSNSTDDFGSIAMSNPNRSITGRKSRRSHSP